MLTLLAALAVTAQAAAPSASADPVLTPAKPTLLALRWHGAEVRARIVVEKRSSSALGLAPEQAKALPASVLVVKRIDLAVDGAELPVPRSAYADLLWVREANLMAGKNGLELVVTGGDGAESYRVVVDFDERAVRRRTLYGGELPEDQPVEETVYHQRVLD